MTDAAARRERRDTREAVKPGPKRQEKPRRPLWQTALAGIAIIMVALFVAVTLTGQGAEEMTETAPVDIQGDALGAIPDGGAADTAVGQPAPEASGVNFEGNEVDLLAEDQGTLLVFLAHWCPVCQREVPVIVDRFADDRPEGVSIVGVPTSTDRSRGNYPPSAWLREAEDWPFGVLVDSSASELAQAYGVNAFPAFVAVGADGHVKARVTGEVPPEGLERLVEAARS